MVRWKPRLFQPWQLNRRRKRRRWTYQQLLAKPAGREVHAASGTTNTWKSSRLSRTPPMERTRICSPALLGMLTHRAGSPDRGQCGLSRQSGHQRRDDSQLERDAHVFRWHPARVTSHIHRQRVRFPDIHRISGQLLRDGARTAPRPTSTLFPTILRRTRVQRLSRTPCATILTSLGGSPAAASVAANWQFYDTTNTGRSRDGNRWPSALARATPIFTLGGDGVTSMSYVPVGNRYLLSSWYYPSVNGPKSGTQTQTQMAGTSNFVFADCDKP